MSPTTPEHAARPAEKSRPADEVTQASPSSSKRETVDQTAESAAIPDSTAPLEATKPANEDESQHSYSDTEEGEVDEIAEAAEAAARKLESDSANPPLPDGPPPDDDGWDFHWDATNQAYYFYNRFTGRTTWENPRVPQAAPSSTASAADAAGSTAAPAPLPPQQDPTAAPSPELEQQKPLLNSSSLPPLPATNPLPAGGYNPAIHGDYDPEAWYAKGSSTDSPNAAVQSEAQDSSSSHTEAMYGGTGTFNRFTGVYQPTTSSTSSPPPPDILQNMETNHHSRHTDEAKSRRQMNAFFDVDAAANQHDGRSLKAERSGIKPSKKELKKFKEKRRARKEEKRRAWLKE